MAEDQAQPKPLATEIERRLTACIDSAMNAATRKKRRGRRRKGSDSEEAAETSDRDDF